MAERKCPHCGSTEFVGIPLASVSGLDVGYDEYVSAMACVKCRHVELVAYPEVVEKELNRIKTEEKKAAEKVKLEKRIKEIKSEIDNLKKISKDENQTVKTVREAKEKIIQLEEELRALQDKLEPPDWPFW